MPELLIVAWGLAWAVACKCNCTTIGPSRHTMAGLTELLVRRMGPDLWPYP